MNTVDAAEETEISRIFESFAFINDIPKGWNPKRLLEQSNMTQRRLAAGLPPAAEQKQ